MRAIRWSRIIPIALTLALSLAGEGGADEGSRSTLPPIFNWTMLVLSLAIVGASGLALWWLLSPESARTRLVLALVTSLSLALRVVHTTDYPRGLNEDEPKVLYAAGKAVRDGTILAESNISVPILPFALFSGQLIPLLGPGRWAIRGYSLVGGVLSTPAAFAVARGLGLAVAPSLAAGALVAVLPWSMFYSRVMTGDELTFFQLLLLAALARLIWPPVSPSEKGGPGGISRSGWREALLGTFALAWMLYGYWPTRSMAPMPLLAAGLATGRRRIWCVAILAAALLLYWPYVVANRDSMFISQGVDLSYYRSYGGISHLGEQFVATLRTFTAPLATNGWLTVAAGAMHPWFVLVLALIGLLGGVRRGLFLAAGFFGGLAPAVLAWEPPSTHRMLMAYPFIALAAAGALDLVRWPLPRRVASAACVLLAGWLSLRLYFSDQFWPPETRWLFDWQRTELAESLPLESEQPVILMRQVGTFRDPRMLLTIGDQDLTVDNWLPGERGGIYAFSQQGAPLRPFYERLLGSEQVQSYGQAFTATFKPSDWSFLRRHGWAYTARCNGIERHGQVPVLYQPFFTFADLPCDQPVEHSWRGRWVGAPARLRLSTIAPATVETPRGRLSSHAVEGEQIVDFDVSQGDGVTITATTPPLQPWVYAALTEQPPASRRLTDWEDVVPLF